MWTGDHGHGPDRDRRRGRVQLLQRAYAETVLAGDEAGAERTIREAIDLGLGEAAIQTEVIAPVMRLVGDLWAAGELSVADEHLATEISIRVLALQREAFRAASRRVRQRVLLAAPEGERHVVGLTMTGNLLVHAGYDVRMLGADVPLDALAGAVDRHRPVAVGLTCTLPATAALVPGAVERIHRADPHVGVLLGGPGTEALTRPLVGTTICRHVSEVVPLLDAIVLRAGLN